MGYTTHVTGEFTITPPLTWSEFKDSRFAPHNVKSGYDPDLILRVDGSQADALVMRDIDEYRAYNLINHVQEAVDAFPGHTFSGHLECEGEENTDMWRVVIRDGIATKVEPRIVWPGDEPAETTLAHVRELLSALMWEAANGCGRWRAGMQRAAEHLDAALGGGSEAECPATATEITPTIAAHVLAHYGEGGHQAGSFTRSLIHTIAYAYIVNMARLAEVFPGYAAAVALARDTADGIDRLKATAGGAT